MSIVILRRHTQHTEDKWTKNYLFNEIKWSAFCDCVTWWGSSARRAVRQSQNIFANEIIIFGRNSSVLCEADTENIKGVAQRERSERNKTKEVRNWNWQMVPHWSLLYRRTNDVDVTNVSREKLFRETFSKTHPVSRIRTLSHPPSSETKRKCNIKCAARVHLGSAIARINVMLIFTFIDVVNVYHVVFGVLCSVFCVCVIRYAVVVCRTRMVCASCIKRTKHSVRSSLL